MGECSNCGAELTAGVKLCPKCGMINNLDYPEFGDEYQDYSLSNEQHNFFQRIFLVLFSREIQTDICRNNNNGEAFILFIFIFIIETIPYYLNYLSFSHMNPVPIVVITELRALQAEVLINLFSPFLIVGISMIGNIITHMKNSYMQVFRLYVFMNLPLSIINLIFSYFISYYQSRVILNNSNANTTIYLILFGLSLIFFLFEIIIVSFGYRTLFNCSYVKAFFIYFIASIIVLILTDLFFSYYVLSSLSVYG